MTALPAQDSVSISDYDIIGTTRTSAEAIHSWLDLYPQRIAIADVDATLAAMATDLDRQPGILGAQINISEWTIDQLQLEVDITEQIPFFIIPYLELADRNFNEWWTQYDRDLTRINLGVDLQLLQLTDRLDPLRLQLQVGFVDEIVMEYTLPFFKKKSPLGIEIETRLARADRIHHSTVDNRRVFSTLEDELVETWVHQRVGLTYRKRPRWTHRIDLGYQSRAITSGSIADFNPQYFRHPATTQQYASLSYTIDYDSRDLRVYPSEGLRVQGAVAQMGLGLWGDISFTQLTSSIDKAKSWSRWRLYLRAAGQKTIAGKVDQVHNRALGYRQDIVRGYQQYVVDGEDYLYAKADMKYKLLSTSLTLGSLMPVRTWREMPISLLIGPHIDTGAVRNRFSAEQNDLAAELLIGYGLGIDIVLYENFVFSLELSRNILGETGLFLGAPTY